MADKEQLKEQLRFISEAVEEAQLAAEEGDYENLSDYANLLTRFISDFRKMVEGEDG